MLNMKYNACPKEKDRERDIGAVGRHFKIDVKIDFLCFWFTIVLHNLHVSWISL